MPIASPFIKIGSRGSSMAAWAMLALLVPCAIYSALYDPIFIGRLIGYALLGMMAETIYTFVVKRKRRLVCMGSGFSAALLAASVPAGMPFLPMLFAILLMTWIVKLPMVGLPLRFNSAMVGRLFLMLVYRDHVVSWGSVDGVSAATPQELYDWEKYPLEYGEWLFSKIGGSWEGLFTLVPGSPGETFPIVLLILGAILCWKGITAWRSPAAFLAAFCLTTWLCGNPPLYNLLSAATIFSAVFIVTDPVSSPMSKGGQLAFGLIVGVANALIRHTTYYTEAIVYAILLGNLCAPFLDRATFELRGWRLNQRKRAK